MLLKVGTHVGVVFGVVVGADVPKTRLDSRSYPQLGGQAVFEELYGGTLGAKVRSWVTMSR